MAAAQRGNRVQIDAAGIVGAVAEHEDGADGQIGGLSGELLEAIADMRHRLGRVQIVDLVHAGELAIHAIEAGLEALLQLGEHATLEGLHGLRFARAAVFVDAHAGGIVHHHGDDVLLRLQLGDHQRGLPQQKQQERGQGALHQPQHAHAPIAEGRNRSRKLAAEQERQAAAYGQDERDQYPLGPAGEQNKFAPGERRSGILEQKFKHDYPALQISVAREIYATPGGSFST